MNAPDPKSERPLETPPLRRPVSHLRFTVRGSDGAGVSTLPPPPFEHETDVAGLEWWLEAHMSLAGGQLCVEQILERSDALGRAVSASLEALRDALYEMYCDAADARMRDQVRADAPLGRYVRQVYSITDEIVTSMLEGVRDTNKLTALGKALEAMGPLDFETWKLTFDEADPLEPLRRLPRDVSALTTAVELLGRVLHLKG